MPPSQPKLPLFVDLLFCLVVFVGFVGVVLVRDSALLLDVNTRLFHTTSNVTSLVVCLLLSGVFLALSRLLVPPRRRPEPLRGALALAVSVVVAGAITALPMGDDWSQFSRWPWLWTRYLNVAAIEEILFRAVLFEVLRKSLGTGGSLAVTSLLFSLAHYIFILLGAPIPIDLVDFLMKTLAGAILCVYYLAFGLVPAVVLHAAIDVLGNSLGMGKQIVVFCVFVLGGAVSILVWKKDHGPKPEPRGRPRLPASNEETVDTER